MPQVFEYAIIRIVPKVEREEFINAGVIVYCAGLKFLDMRYELNEKKLVALSNTCDLSAIASHLAAFERICAGGADAGPIGKLPPADRFRWLTATRSTVVQTSKVHTGLAEHIEEIVEKLFLQLVLHPG